MLVRGCSRGETAGSNDVLAGRAGLGDGREVRAGAGWDGAVRHLLDLHKGYHTPPRAHAWQDQPAVGIIGAPGVARGQGFARSRRCRTGSSWLRSARQQREESTVDARAQARSGRSTAEGARRSSYAVTSVAPASACSSERTSQRASALKAHRYSSASFTDQSMISS